MLLAGAGSSLGGATGIRTLAQSREIAIIYQNSSYHRNPYHPSGSLSKHDNFDFPPQRNAPTHPGCKYCAGIPIDSSITAAVDYFE